MSVLYHLGGLKTINSPAMPKVEENMDIYNDWIQNLPAVERSRLVEQIWDGLSLETSPIPLPESAVSEAKRRRDEMIAEPQLGNSHDDVWKRINEKRDA